MAFPGSRTARPFISTAHPSSSTARPSGPAPRPNGPTVHPSGKETRPGSRTVWTVQEILNHKSVKTTMIYSHAQSWRAGGKSPLDAL